jgi:hypothetical protein
MGGGSGDHNVTKYGSGISAQKKIRKASLCSWQIVLLIMSATRLHHKLQKLKKFEDDRSEGAEVE